MLGPDAEGIPQGSRGQVVAHVNHILRRGFDPPGDAQAELEQWGIPHQSLPDEVFGDADMADVENFQFRLRARLLDHLGHLFDHRHQVDESAGPEVQSPHIQRTKLGL